MRGKERDWRRQTDRDGRVSSETDRPETDRQTEIERLREADRQAQRVSSETGREGEGVGGWERDREKEKARLREAGIQGQRVSSKTDRPETDREGGEREGERGGEGERQGQRHRERERERERLREADRQGQRVSSETDRPETDREGGAGGGRWGGGGAESYDWVEYVYLLVESCFTSRVQELCESRGGRPGLSVLMSLTVFVGVKQHWTMLRHWSQFVPDMSTDIRGHEALHHHRQPYVHRNRRLIRDGSPGRPPWLSHSSLSSGTYQRTSEHAHTNFMCIVSLTSRRYH